MTRRIAPDTPKFAPLSEAASGPMSDEAPPCRADTIMEGLVWFLRRSSHSNGRLIFEVDAELASRLRLAARASEQTPEALAAELLARGLEQEAQRSRAQSVLEALTPREQEVTWLTARGYTNRQIAKALVLSPETVKTHMRHVLEKLGLRSKGDLRLLLLDLGIRWWEETPSE